MAVASPTPDNLRIITPVVAKEYELRREFVAGGNWSWLGNAVRALSPVIDEVASDFGDDIYERMMFDPQVAAVISILKASILETGPTIVPAISDPDDKDYDKSKEIAAQVERMLSDLEQPFDDVLWDLLDSVALGNKVAEATYEMGSSIKGTQMLLLRKLKTKPRSSTLFAVDAYTNLIGLLARRSATGVATPGTIFDVQRSEYDGVDSPFRIIPPSKFVISTFRPRDNDPRGTSILRAAYSPWWRKQQIVPEYIRYIAQFAGPSIIGFTPEDAQDVIDPDNEEATVTPQQVMLAALQELRNGTAAVFPYGAQTKEIVMNGDGAAFLRGIAQCDQQITKAVLTQELATEEGRHMARAAAEVHQDVLDTLVRQGKISASKMIRNQIFRVWVEMNYGNEAVYLAPYADLGATEERDQPAMWQSVAALVAGGYFSLDQLQALDKKLGLPIRQELPDIAPGTKPQPEAAGPQPGTGRSARAKRTVDTGSPKPAPSRQPRAGSTA